MRFILRLIVVAILMVSVAHAVAATEAVVMPDGTEVTMATHPADGESLFIWLPSEAGPQPSDVQIAQQLSQLGIEVWRADLVDARFLPVAPSSVDQLPASDVAALITHALNTAGKRVFVVGTGRSVIPILRGVLMWQRQDAQSSQFGGVILLSPKFFVKTPEPGVAPELMPIVTVSNLPIYIFQPDQSPWYWKLGETIPALERGGSDVFVRLQRNVRDRFYFRPDATQLETVEARRLPKLLASAARALMVLPQKPRTPVKQSTPAPKVPTSKPQRSLKVYRGNTVPPPLVLKDMFGRDHSLAAYRGKVVLVNFWASWCPPCVHEMPSMQRLANRLSGQPFETLAVNMAENKAVVAEFLKHKVDINFPVLLDADGAALQRWQVFAFPTSFMIGKAGRIRYALFGAIEWDNKEVVEKVRVLLDEHE